MEDRSMMFYTVTYHGCREYLRRREFISEGHLETRPYLGRIGGHLTLAAIKETVADHYRVSVREMNSARRAREIARPRQVAMYLSKALTRKSLPEIGRFYGGRDHTTVIHAIRKIEQLKAEDAVIAQDVALLCRALEAA
jgi:chromosomal replication initiation ATPase DnaA